MLDIVHQPLLDIHDLTVDFATRRGTVTAVRNIDISVGKGETLGIVANPVGQVGHVVCGDAHSRPRRSHCHGQRHVFRD